MIISHFSDKTFFTIFFQAEALQAETPVNVVVNLDVPFDTIIDRIKARYSEKRIFKNLFFLLFRFGIWAQKVFFTAFDWYFTPWIRILRTALKNSFIFNEF